MTIKPQQSAIELAINAINELCKSTLDYETRHSDAGDSYAHMPAESWTEQKTQDLIKSLNGEKRNHAVEDHFATDSYRPQWELLGVDPLWILLDFDTLADLALKSFYMQAGSVNGCFKEGITLDAYTVQEIEIYLDHLEIDAMTMDLVRESCDAYISGTDLAYVTTDACWFALLDIEAFNAHISQHLDDGES